MELNEYAYCSEPWLDESKDIFRRSRLFRQYLEISFVALCNHTWSVAKRIISTAANHLGAFGVGSPNGVSLPTAIKT